MVPLRVAGVIQTEDPRILSVGLANDLVPERLIEVPIGHGEAYLIQYYRGLFPPHPQPLWPEALLMSHEGRVLEGRILGMDRRFSILVSVLAIRNPRAECVIKRQRMRVSEILAVCLAGRLRVLIDSNIFLRLSGPCDPAIWKQLEEIEAARQEAHGKALLEAWNEDVGDEGLQ